MAADYTGQQSGEIPACESHCISLPRGLGSVNNSMRRARQEWIATGVQR